MPGETRAPRALLLTRSESHRERARSVLSARGWHVIAAEPADACSVVERNDFSLIVVEFVDQDRCRRVHDLCRAASRSGSHLLVITGPARIEEAAAVIAEGPGDLLVAPFDEAQLHGRIAMAEARLHVGNSLAATAGSVAKRLQELENSLRYHRASLEELFQNAPEGIAIVDSDDRVIRVNDEFTRMFGYTADVALGRPINDLIAPEHLMEEAMALTRGVHNGKFAVEETLRRRSDGSLLDVSILATPIAVGDGHHGAFAIYRDISVQKAQQRALQASEARYRDLLHRAEQVNVELRERSQEIEMTMEAKNRLYTALNHELRTPISAIMLYQELLLAGSMGDLLPDQRDALERSHTAARHLLDVVRDVLDLSRIEAGGMGSRQEDVTPADLLQELALTAQPLANLHGSHIELEVEADLPSFRSDPQKLRQIVLNLLSNAAKFGRSRPIGLHCRQEGEKLLIEVRDRGIGIEEKNHALIFEDFVQVEEGRGGGTGLGLSISRRLAGLLGGKLEVESELGAGSTFRLTLPVRVPLSSSLEEVFPR
jgi:PAS domain S-box-containing protein